MNPDRWISDGRRGLDRAVSFCGQFTEDGSARLSSSVRNGEGQRKVEPGLRLGEERSVCARAFCVQEEGQRRLEQREARSAGEATERRMDASSTRGRRGDGCGV